MMDIEQANEAIADEIKEFRKLRGELRMSETQINVDGIIEGLEIAASVLDGTFVKRD